MKHTASEKQTPTGLIINCSCGWRRARSSDPSETVRERSWGLLREAHTAHVQGISPLDRPEVKAALLVHIAAAVLEAKTASGNLAESLGGPNSALAGPEFSAGGDEERWERYFYWMTDQDGWATIIAKLGPELSQEFDTHFERIGNHPTQDVIDLFSQEERKVFGKTVEESM